MLLALLFADGEFNANNVGGAATGVGLAAIAGVAIPIITKLLDWMDKQRDKAREYEKDKRKEEVEAQTRLMNVIEKMATATATHSEGLDDMRADLRWLMDYVRRTNGTISLPPPTPPPPSTRP